MDLVVLVVAGVGARQRSHKRRKKSTGKFTSHAPFSSILGWSTTSYLISSCPYCTERLTVDQNKQLCKAIKVRHVGNKKDLMVRISHDT